MIILGLTKIQAQSLIDALEDWTEMTDKDLEIDAIIDSLKEKIED